MDYEVGETILKFVAVEQASQMSSIKTRNKCRENICSQQKVAAADGALRRRGRDCASLEAALKETCKYLASSLRQVSCQ